MTFGFPVSSRDLMTLAIMEILRQVANGLPSGSPPIALHDSRESGDSRAVMYRSIGASAWFATVARLNQLSWGTKVETSVRAHNWSFAFLRFQNKRRNAWRNSD
jgi:hypothetical protein